MPFAGNRNNNNANVNNQGNNANYWSSSPYPNDNNAYNLNFNNSNVNPQNNNNRANGNSVRCFKHSSIKLTIDYLTYFILPDAMKSYNKQVDVFQCCFELLVSISKASISFSREYKYTFGERIINYTLDIISEVYLAKEVYQTQEKIIHIDNALKGLALLDILWKACAEIPNLSINVYTQQIENIVGIKRQLNARNEYCKKNINKQS